MNEQLLQFIWQHRYFSGTKFTTAEGDSLVIRKQGLLNTNQGPDFTHAEILLNGIVFFGNVELHIRSSDWYKHKHEFDERYQHIILHVVWISDKVIYNSDGAMIPSLVLEPFVSSLLLERFKRLMLKRKGLPCESLMEKVEPIIWHTLLDRMCAERLERKAFVILQHLQEHAGDWNMVTMRLLARVMGGSVNGDAFERIVQQLSYVQMKQLADRQLSMQAWLFGVAGLLNGIIQDMYPQQLQDEFSYLRKKYRYIEKPECKAVFLRMRPAGFPTIRLSQLGILIARLTPIFDQLFRIHNKEEGYKLLNVSAERYWDDHFCFDQQAPHLVKTIGVAQKDLILINVVSPLLFAFGCTRGDQGVKERAIQLLSSVSPEQNTIVNYWSIPKVPKENAMHTQALVELYNFYCTKKRCLQCGAGNVMLKKGILTN